MNERQQKDLGRTLRLIRHARQLTLRDVARRAGRSYQYVQNIESGTRGRTLTDDADFAAWIARGYGIDEAQARALVARAGILSALASIGVPPEQSALTWSAIEGLVRGSGGDVRVSLAELLEPALRT